MQIIVGQPIDEYLPVIRDEWMTKALHAKTPFNRDFYWEQTDKFNTLIVQRKRAVPEQYKVYKLYDRKNNIEWTQVLKMRDKNETRDDSKRYQRLLRLWKKFRFNTLPRTKFLRSFIRDQSNH